MSDTPASEPASGMVIDLHPNPAPLPAIAPQAAVEHAPMPKFSREQVAVIKSTIAKGCSDAELALFVQVAERTGLDPFARQIFAIARWNWREERNEMAIQTSIDGYRLIAERSNRYEGQDDQEWCGPDGKWTTLWTSDEPPFAARTTVYKTGFRVPMRAQARWAAYVQTYKKNGAEHVTQMWQRMGPEMLGKCSEALALRKAFPQELSGLYTAEEMGQAYLGAEVPVAAPEHVDAIRRRVAQLPDDKREMVQARFRDRFHCVPARLPQDQVGAAFRWLDDEGVPELAWDDEIGPDGTDTPPGPSSPSSASTAPVREDVLAPDGLPSNPEFDVDPDDPHDHAHLDDPVPETTAPTLDDPPEFAPVTVETLRERVAAIEGKARAVDPEPEPEPLTDEQQARWEATWTECAAMLLVDLSTKAAELGLKAGGNKAALVERVATHLFRDPAYTPAKG